MSHVKGYPSRGTDGLAYDVSEYSCSHDKNYVIWWSPQDTDDSSEE